MPEELIPTDDCTGLDEYNQYFEEQVREWEDENASAEYEEPDDSWEKIHDLRHIPTKEQKWLVEGLIPEGDITFFTGDFGSFKSYLAWFLADAVDRGTQFLERDVRQHPVLILDLENSQATVSLRRNRIGELASEASRVKFMGKFASPGRPRAFPFAWQEDPRLQFNKAIQEEADSRKANYEQLKKICKMYKPVVILDSFGDFHPGLDENDADDMTIFMRRLLQLVENGAPAVIALHHIPKAIEASRGTNYRGSTAIPALAGCLLRVKKEGKTGVTIEGIKNRDGEDQDIRLEMCFGLKKTDYLMRPPKAAEDEAKKLAMEERNNVIYGLADEGMSQAQIAKEVGLTQPTVSYVLRRRKI